MPGHWPVAEPITTVRLTLEPLSPAHAAGMVDVLADTGLYAFTGGDPPTVDELTARYERQSKGHSPDGAQGWLNWVVRHTATGDLVGTVQATLSSPTEAEIAWVTGSAHQGNGFATEAATAMLTWLGARGTTTYRAHIHPTHEASKAVARRLSMTPTTKHRDGEQQWHLRRHHP